jgi:hypothetical protein
MRAVPLTPPPPSRCRSALARAACSVRPDPASRNSALDRGQRPQERQHAAALARALPRCLAQADIQPPVGAAHQADHSALDVDVARHQPAEQQLADGERDTRVGHRGAGAVRRAHDDARHANVERLVRGAEPFPGQGGAADVERGAGPEQQALFAARQGGDVDRPLREAPGQQAGAGAEQPDGQDDQLRQQVEQGDPTRNPHALTGCPARALVPP